MAEIGKPALHITLFFFFFFFFFMSFQTYRGEAGPKYSFLHQARSGPADRLEYDYIVIGGGTSGCPLAATLSKNYTVLLLERGGTPYGNKNISNEASFIETLSDTSPSSASQRFISEDGVINARARVLGGGSCLNAGFYTHASADYIAETGWDAKLVNESYDWVEKVVVNKPVMLQWQSAMRDGLLEVGVEPFNGYTFDHVYGTKIGGSIFDQSGHRHSAADLLRFSEPDNLTVLLHATVHRILFKYKGRKIPKAHGVVFQDGTGKKHRVYLKKDPKSEIVISAGALGSPQLLILSGVGPSEQLKSLGINMMVEQPLVGQGMSDNPMNAIFVPSPVPVEISLIRVVGITRLGTYIEGASGSNFAGVATDFGMLSPQTVQPKQKTPEAIAKAIETLKALPTSSFRGGFLLEKVIGPVSKGDLKVISRNPGKNPKVKFNYFKDPEDLRRCVEGLKTIEKVIDSKAFSRFRYAGLSVQNMMNITAGYPMNLLPRHSNDSVSLEQYCKDTVMTIWHYHGGCRTNEVVDSDYRVIGADGLRVIDGSTFHSSPGTNPQATVMMLGRYMGIKIIGERSED